jgi:hypothetical protein
MHSKAAFWLSTAAMGTMLQQQRLTAADFGGPVLEGCNEILVKTRPDVVLGLRRFPADQVVQRSMACLLSNSLQPRANALD